MSELGWGLQMTVAGMGTVFALLIALMGLLLLIGRLDRSPAPASPPTEAGLSAPTDDSPAATPPSVERPPTSTTDDSPAAAPPPTVRVLADGLTDEMIAAITVAVLSHRELRRKEAAPEMRAHAPGSHLYASRWVSIGRSRQIQSWRRK
ncbi:OadG family transporter subunit [Austwickia chelonae]|uniref:OadG family transporter subunit n=1 Tax=Austwickia chelonae TaxID=100225 RepID=UPI000E269E66|nr:OadG family transporter subunit [Austwickia chelonae]